MQEIGNIENYWVLSERSVKAVDVISKEGTKFGVRFLTPKSNLEGIKDD